MPPLVQPSPVIRMQFFDANGDPLALGWVYTFAAGTNTPLATYTDHTGTSQNTNPIHLDSGGYADIWLTADSYKIRVEDANHVPLYTIDGLPGIGSLITVGDLLPLFTSSLAAGALNFAFQDAGPGTLFGRFAGMTGPPTYGVIGSDKELTFNNAGAMDGDPNLTWDAAALSLQVRDGISTDARIRMMAVPGGGGGGQIWFGSTSEAGAPVPRIKNITDFSFVAKLGQDISFGNTANAQGFRIKGGIGVTWLGISAQPGQAFFNDGSSGVGGFFGPMVTAGVGSPEGVLVAEPGSLYLNTAGGAVTSLYVKESGSGNVGWIAK